MTTDNNTIPAPLHNQPHHPETAELHRRLEAAELVCLLYGWSPVNRSTSSRSAATRQAWMKWHDLVGGKFIDKQRTVVTDPMIERLATDRAVIEMETLGRIASMR